MGKQLINKSGITITELKKFIKDLPETDEYGNAFEVVLVACSNVVMIINYILICYSLIHFFQKHIASYYFLFYICADI